MAFSVEGRRLTSVQFLVSLSSRPSTQDPNIPFSLLPLDYSRDFQDCFLTSCLSHLRSFQRRQFWVSSSTDIIRLCYSLPPEPILAPHYPCTESHQPKHSEPRSFQLHHLAVS